MLSVSKSEVDLLFLKKEKETQSLPHDEGRGRDQCLYFFYSPIDFI